MTVRHFRDLIVWQRAMELVVMIYRVTDEFPSRELFGLTTQLHRAAVSVHRGSLQEVQTQIEFSRLLNLTNVIIAAELSERANEVARLINGLCRSLDTDH